MRSVPGFRVIHSERMLLSQLSAGAAPIEIESGFVSIEIRYPESFIAANALNEIEVAAPASRVSVKE